MTTRQSPRDVGTTSITQRRRHLRNQGVFFARLKAYRITQTIFGCVNHAANFLKETRNEVHHRTYLRNPYWRREACSQARPYGALNMAIYWTGDIGCDDDFNEPIQNVFYDAKMITGQWAIMAPSTWKRLSGRIGTGYGQKYEKQSDGRWMKVEG